MGLIAVADCTSARIHDVTYRYPGSADPALQRVSLDLRPGLVGVAGGSGSGKSTLLRLFNGLVPHFHGGSISGEVRVHGHDALRTPTATLARDVGFVFQDPEAQFVRAIVEDEVAFALENTAMPRALIGARVDEAMAAAGISSLTGRTIDSLSGGERQRVAIASAIALRPGILVLDEPTSQLDPEGTATVLAACSALARMGTTVVLSEHRVASLLSVTDRLVIMDSGSAEGPSDVPSMLRHLPDPPPLIALGRALGWSPLPLTVADALPLAGALLRASRSRFRPTGELAWELRGCQLGHARIDVLQSVDLGGGAGEVTVLMGPNGSGKTTLLRAIAGLHRPRVGSVWRRPGRVAYLPQDPGILLHRSTVRAEVSYTLQRARSSQPVDLVLSRLGMVEWAGKYPGDLSSGQRQRAALASILAGDPALVLLDEPTRGMDGGARRALVALLREMTAGGASVVVATHDVDLAAELAHRVVIVEGGIAREAVEPAEIFGGVSPYATDIGRLYPGGPLTVAEAIACL